MVKIYTGASVFFQTQLQLHHLDRRNILLYMTHMGHVVGLYHVYLMVGRLQTKKGDGSG
jgi:hypothetical protein